MDKREAQEQLDYVTRILERSTQYTNISAWSAISVGIIGTAAGAYSEWILKGSMAYVEYVQALFYCWSASFAVSIAAAIFFSARRARRMKERLWVTPIKHAVRHFAVFIFIGGILTLALSSLNFFFLIPSVWMLCYGGGIFIGSSYSLKEVRWLGTFFLAAGSLTVFDPRLNQILLMSTFGLGHLVLGGIVYFKYNRLTPKGEYL